MINDTDGRKAWICPVCHRISYCLGWHCAKCANLGERPADEIRMLTLTEIAEINARQAAKWSEEDKAFTIDIAGVSAFGDTPEEALAEFSTALTLVVESLTARQAEVVREVSNARDTNEDLAVQSGLYELALMEIQDLHSDDPCDHSPEDAEFCARCIARLALNPQEG